MPTQTYTDNLRGKVVNIIPKRTIRHAHNPNALKTEKIMMFTIPEILVNFEMKNLLKMF
jgi:hypothetical protein